jgi:hypothetical protein
MRPLTGRAVPAEPIKTVPIWDETDGDHAGGIAAPRDGVVDVGADQAADSTVTLVPSSSSWRMR